VLFFECFDGNGSLEFGREFSSISRHWFLLVYL
jgi:hypothetical protein